MWQRGFNDPKRRINVGFHRRVKVFARDVENGFARLLPRSVADEDVDAA